MAETNLIRADPLPIETLITVRAQVLSLDASPEGTQRQSLSKEH
jgi:hypothetical protein